MIGSDGLFESILERELVTMIREKLAGKAEM
jgi:hypothetical protein